MEHINSIINYIEYLKKEKNYCVTIHIHSKYKPLVTNEIKKYGLHNNPYCSSLKKIKESYWRCLKCQRDAVEKSIRDGDFCGVCHAGVFEYVYPITLNDKTSGILSVGGYKVKNHNEYISKVADKYGFDEQMLRSAYTALNDNIPQRDEVDVLISPLLAMLELLSFKQAVSVDVHTTLFDNILEYLRCNYTQKITTENICDKFFCSRSYIAHSFKKNTGKSLPEYVNELRIESAKDMLKNSSISVAEIAVLAGFEERSYFSKCFAKITGMSPKQWRQKNKKYN